MAGAGLKLLGLCGSLRRGSYNKKLLNIAADLAEEQGAFVETFGLSAIPLYNEDVKEKGFPDIVKQFRQKIASSDGLLIASPEYNFSFTGVLKNAIDWASRPPEQPFSGKCAAIFGASDGGFGSVRGQLHLRQVLMSVNISAVNYPQVHIANADDAFDEKGKLKDEKKSEQLGKLVAALLKAIEKNK
ncbi:MAG: NADPH-dependent FMN reductase [Candidatus Diapherotrites archaeon]